MSLLIQAKREAKRLLKLSQENNSAIQIKSLSEARKYYAALKGYHNWHDYEENIKRQDFIQGNQLPEHSKLLDIEDDVIDYFLQNSEFIVHLMEKKEPILPVIENKSHIPGVLGITQKKKTLFQTEEKWLLNSFPCTIIGSSGSGRTECWLSQAQQWIANGEGFIGVDGRGWSGSFKSIFQIAEKTNRKNDISILNLTLNDLNEEKISNTFDLINPLIGEKINDNKLFKNLFGEEIGEVIHAIAFQAKSNNMLLDSENIKSILMINNLIAWNENKIFGEDASKSIANYLKNNLQINSSWDQLSDDEKDDVLLKHADLCSNSKKVIEIIKQFEDAGILTKTPEINLKDIFLQRKILLIFLPTLEKSWDVMKVFSNSIVAQIWKIARQIEKEMEYKPCFLQNIVLDDVSYYIPNSLIETIFNNLPKNSNFVFTFQSFHSYNNNNSLIHALSASKTIIMMRLEDPFGIPLQLKGRIVENVETNLHILNKKGYYDLKSQREGCGYVYMEVDQIKESTFNYDYKFTNDSTGNYDIQSKIKHQITYKDFINNEKKSFFEPLNFTYIASKEPYSFKFNKHKIQNKIIRSFPLSELIG